MARNKGSVLICGARLCEPQHVALKITLLRVTDPRSESKFDLSGNSIVTNLVPAGPSQKFYRVGLP